MSVTLIDTLVVALGLDSRDLESKAPGATKSLEKLEKQGDKTEKSVTKISSTSKETARNVESLNRTLGGFLAIIGGTMAIRAFVSDFIGANAQLDRLSKNLGIGVSDISAWSNASEQLGGTAQGLQGTLDMLSKSQTQLMLTGESSLIPYMSALGISLADTAGKARPVTDILLDLSDRFSHLNRTEANNIGRMMGIDQGTMNLLLQGRKELELEIRRQKEQNAVTKQQAEEAQKLQRSLTGVKQTFAAFGRTLLMDAAPGLEWVFTKLQDFGTWIQQNQEFVEDFLKVLAVGLAAVGLAASPITLTSIAILAVAAAIALLWQDYQTWKKGGDSLIDWGKWEPGIDAATAAIRNLDNVIKGLLGNKDAAKQFMNDFQTGLVSIAGKLGFHINYEDEARKRLAAQNAAHPVTPTDLAKQPKMSGKDIAAYFVKQGWSPAQAAGIASNVIAESSGKSGLTGDNGTAFGLAQWHKDRQANFKAWAGKDIHQATAAEQLAFIQYELTQGSEKGAGDQLKKALTGTEAGSIVSRAYERPKDVAGEASRRGAYAQSLLGIPGASAVAASAPQAGGASGTSIDRSVKTDIGTIQIQTQATDAPGIARDLEKSLDFLFASQANYGLTG